MSEEEKAIETLKEVASDDFDTLGDDISPKMAQNILNVINKQQDKIVDLQTKLAIEKIDNKYNQEERDEETIPRYKIRDVLNYLDNTDLNNYEIVIAFRKMMKELLEDDGDHIPRID